MVFAINAQTLRASERKCRPPCRALCRASPATAGLSLHAPRRMRRPVVEVAWVMRREYCELPSPADSLKAPAVQRPTVGQTRSYPGPNSGSSPSQLQEILLRHMSSKPVSGPACQVCRHRSTAWHPFVDGVLCKAVHFFRSLSEIQARTTCPVQVRLRDDFSAIAAH